MAFRNLRKYKTQNIISIIGLAIGFTCFAFSALWIRYEMSYDSFHAKADRIYRVNAAPFKWDTMGGSVSEIQTASAYTLANWLKTNFPEIEEACAIQIRKFDEKFSFLYFDQNFCKIFDVNLPENFFIEGQTDKPVAVTPELDNEEIAKSIKEQFTYDVQMTVPRWPANTNIQFSIAVPLPVRNYPAQIMNSWGLNMFDTYILIKYGVDMEALAEKLDKVDIPEWKSNPISLILTPLTQLRYKDPTGQIQSDVKFAHIRIFAIAGLLVILCSLLNHLTLYVTRVRMRLRELALRKVNGATNWQIAATLYADFLLVIVLSLVVGFLLMAWLLPTFKEYSSIGVNNVNIYFELLLYAVLLIICGFIAGGIPVLYFCKQVLNESIKGAGSPGSKNLFRKGSLLVQLIISLGMMFCAAVFVKQIRFLHQAGLGLNRYHIATVEPPSYSQLPPQYVNRIKQVPGVIDAIPVRYNAFLRNMTLFPTTIEIEKDGQKVNYTYYLTHADARFFDFFGVEIIEGMGHSNEPDNKMVINETMMKDLGREIISTKFDVIGVARDFYLTPTTKARPTAILYGQDRLYTTIAYKYEEGFRQQIEEATEKFIREDFPDFEKREIYRHYMEDIFEEHFKSEQALLTLLSVMTLACILIAVFGVYSLASLTCQQRKKEIAIRKVHGAEVLDIMNIFFKEYLILLALAALVAFPAGYLIMKSWMEGYVKQTSMDAWLYVAIFLMVFVVIVFSIVWMVWNAANRNPAEVVKSE
jgi:hypothetical protein